MKQEQDDEDDEQVYDASKPYNFVKKTDREVSQQSGFNSAESVLQQISAGFLRAEEFFLAKLYADAYRCLISVTYMASQIFTVKEMNELNTIRKADEEVISWSEVTRSKIRKMHPRKVTELVKKYNCMVPPKERLLNYLIHLRKIAGKHGCLNPPRRDNVTQFEDMEIAV